VDNYTMSADSVMRQLPDPNRCVIPEVDATDEELEQYLPLVEGLTSAMSSPSASPPRLPEPPIPTWVNGREVVVQRSLLERPGEVPAASVAVTVNLTVEDVLAVLVAANPTWAELRDDGFLREIAAGAVLNFGCLKLEEWRTGPGPGFVDSPEEETGAYVAALRQRVTEVFGGAVDRHAA